MPFDYIFVFIIGACVGSFLNVCIYRIPRHLSLIRPGSRCPKCGVSISWRDNIPILSYFILRGKCRNCGEPISLQYPIVESLMAGCWLLIYHYSGMSIFFVSYSIFSALLILSFFIDLHHLIIPDLVTIPGIAIGFLFATLTGGMRTSLFGILLGAGILLSAAYLGKFFYKKDVMGGGDVKLASMVGAFLGWKYLLLTLFISFFSGALVGLILIALKKKTMASSIPFGPFISASAILTLIYGEKILLFYLNLYV